MPEDAGDSGVNRVVYVLILNWNGWRDTVECIESVLRSSYSSYRVIVCDNGSEDGSLERIKAWAEGQADQSVPEHDSLRALSFPPVPKPVRCVCYDRSEAESGGKADETARIILINTGGNLGFAGGNNVGLRYALARDDFDYIWLLNNDTVVTPDALQRMLDRIREKPSAGMCGSKLLFYHNPKRVQTLGGASYNKWTGMVRHIGVFQPADRDGDFRRIERKMAYVTGASMLVTKPFLRDIGLMSEDYFLYYEELDWATRAGGRYSLAYAPKSVVYHKEGNSIGSSSKPEEKSLTADYYGLRNRLTITKKFFPLALPTVYLSLLGAIFNRCRRRQWDRIRMIARMLRGTQ